MSPEGDLSRLLDTYLRISSECQNLSNVFLYFTTYEDKSQLNKNIFLCIIRIFRKAVYIKEGVEVKSGYVFDSGKTWHSCHSSQGSSLPYLEKNTLLSSLFVCLFFY